MIVYRTGDVVEAFKKGEIDVLVQGVNCQGKMNSGIAKQIRKEFPVVFERYEDHVNEVSDSDYVLLGKVQFIHAGGKGKYVVNAFTQDEYGYAGDKFCSYDAIDIIMKNLNQLIDKTDSVGMPKIGAGLGGGDWKVIEAIINSHFPDRDIFVYALEEKKTDGRNDNA